MLRLWGFRYSTNADRVVLALEHKGLAYEEVAIDPADRSAVEELTGQALVPVVEWDGEVLWDSPRILAEIERRQPDSPLFPADPAERAQAEIFLDWFNRVWKLAPNALAAGGPDPALEAEMDEHTARLEALLSDGREYLLGGFGIVDVTAWPFLRYATDDDPEDTDPFHEVLRRRVRFEGRPALAAWEERMAARSPRRFGVPRD